MQAQGIEPIMDFTDLDELGAVQIDLGDDALATGARRRTPEIPESNTLLVGALNAVARLRDTVDRVVVLDQVRRMVENEQTVLDQQIAREQRILNAIIQNGRARLRELHARRKTVRRALERPAPHDGDATEVKRLGTAGNVQHGC